MNITVVLSERNGYNLTACHSSGRSCEAAMLRSIVGITEENVGQKLWTR